jgi:hypothetical protein
MDALTTTSPSAVSTVLPTPGAPLALSPTPGLPTATTSVAAPSAVAVPVVLSPTGTASARIRTDLVTDPNTVFPMSEIPKPSYLVSFNDPIFRTRIIRIAGDPGTTFTALNGTGTWGSDVRQHYTDDQPWNADGSLLLLQNLQGGTPNQVILDGNTYQPKYVKCSNYHNYDDRWNPSRSHPDERINVHGATLEWFDVITCEQTRVWTLPFPADRDFSQNPTADGRFAVLHDDAHMFVVDMDPQPPYAPYPNRRIGPIYTFPSCGSSSDCHVSHPVTLSPDGKYVVVHYQGDFARVFDVDANTLAITVHPEPIGSLECSGRDPAQGYIFDLGHVAIALDPSDNDEPYLVGQNRDWCPQMVNGIALGQVLKVRLKDDQVRSLTRPPREAQAYHVSAMNYARPGWVYASYWPGAGRRFQDEILAITLDGTQTIERLTQDHTDTTNCYRCESHPVPSRDGLRVIFASSWTLACGSGCGSSTNPQAYVVETLSSAP